jgi:hypothetical protein
VTRRLLVLAAAVLVLTPAAAFAGTSTRSASANANASAQCTALRAKLGTGPFAQAFDTFGGCVSNFVPLALRNASTAASTCRAMRADAGFAAAHGGKSFDVYYGTGSTHEKAFANCVRATIAARIATEVSVAARCLPEQASVGFAASHGGKTFAQFYGTSNALKRCVVLKVTPLTVVQAQTPTPAPTETTPAQPTPQPQPYNGTPSVIARECGGSGTAPLHPQPLAANVCTVASSAG